MWYGKSKPKQEKKILNFLSTMEIQNAMNEEFQFVVLFQQLLSS